MKEAIDLFAKLVIGTFSFIGPSFTLLIPLFYAALEKSREKHQLQLKNLWKIIQDNITDDTNYEKQIAAGSKLLEGKIKSNKKELNLLDSKRQVIRIFRSLLSAILLIIFYYFQNSHFWFYKYEAISRTIIGISIVTFVYSLLVLWQIFCTIIKIKLEEETATPAKNIKLKKRGIQGKKSGVK